MVVEHRTLHLRAPQTSASPVPAVARMSYGAAMPQIHRYDEPPDNVQSGRIVTLYLLPPSARHWCSILLCLPKTDHGPFLVKSKSLHFLSGGFDAITWLLDWDCPSGPDEHVVASSQLRY